MEAKKVNTNGAVPTTCKNLIQWIEDAPKNGGLSLDQMIRLAKRVGMDTSPYTDCFHCREHIIYAYASAHILHAHN